MELHGFLEVLDLLVFSLGCSTVEEVLAARWRPRNGFLAPQGAPRAYSSERYKEIMKNHGTYAKIAM